MEAVQKEAHYLSSKSVEFNEAWHQMQKKNEAEKMLSAGEMTFSSNFHRQMYTMLHQPWFEGVFTILIVFNFVCVIMETDCVAEHRDVPQWITISSWIVLWSFVLELVLRVYVKRLLFFVDGMNVFDFILVTVDTGLNLLSVVLGEAFPVSFLRIVRLSKLARITKAFHAFAELRLMVAGLIGAMRTIFWGALLLVIFLLVFAIVAVQFLHPLMEDIAKRDDWNGCDRCGRAYGNTFNAALTLWQTLVAGDSWGSTSIDLIEEHPATALYFVASLMFIGMAVLNLILGIVVDVASQARNKLSDELKNEQLLQKSAAENHLMELCKTLDEDNSGEINKNELADAFQTNPKFQEVCNSLGIHTEDIDVLWTILDSDGSGSISVTEFVTSCYKMTASNTQFMLAYVKYYICVIKDKICEEILLVKADIQKNEALIVKEEETILKEEMIIEDAVAKVSAQEEQIAREIGKVRQTLEGVGVDATPPGNRMPASSMQAAQTSPQAAFSTSPPIQTSPPPPPQAARTVPPEEKHQSAVWGKDDQLVQSSLDDIKAALAVLAYEVKAVGGGGANGARLNELLSLPSEAQNKAKMNPNDRLEPKDTSWRMPCMQVERAPGGLPARRES